MISFPRGTEMFQFPRLPSRAYVFSSRWRRTTGAGLPHSGIHGSKAVQHLTVAYRSRPRPSSTPGAKASTVCPSYLDGDPSTGERLAPSGIGGSVIPRFVWPTVRFSRSGEGTARGDSAGRSLKTQQRAPAACATRSSGPGRRARSAGLHPGAEALEPWHDGLPSGSSLERR